MPPTDNPSPTNNPSSHGNDKELLEKIKNRKNREEEELRQFREKSHDKFIETISSWHSGSPPPPPAAHSKVPEKQNQFFATCTKDQFEFILCRGWAPEEICAQLNFCQFPGFLELFRAQGSVYINTIKKRYHELHQHDSRTKKFYKQKLRQIPWAINLINQEFEIVTQIENEQAQKILANKKSLDEAVERISNNTFCFIEQAKNAKQGANSSHDQEPTLSAPPTCPSGQSPSQENVKGEETGKGKESTIKQEMASADWFSREEKEAARPIFQQLIKNISEHSETEKLVAQRIAELERELAQEKQAAQKPAPAPQDQPVTSTSSTPPPPPSDKNPNVQPPTATKAPTGPNTPQQITTPLQTMQIPQSQERKKEQPQPRPQAPTFTQTAKYALKKGLAAGAGELIRSLVHEAIHGIFSHEQPYFHTPLHDDLPFPEALTAPLSYQGFDPVVSKCLLGDVHPESNGMPHFASMPHLQDLDPIVRECFCNDGPIVDHQSILSSHPQPTISDPTQDPQFYEPVVLPIIEPTPAQTPLTLSSPVNAAEQGGIIHDQQPSALSSSSLSSSCSSTPPLHTMDTTTTTQSCDRVAFFNTRSHCFDSIDKALGLAEGLPSKPLVENTCRAAETLDKIAQVLNESGEFGLSRECVYYADACAIAAHCFADSTSGIFLGLNDMAFDCAHAAAHPIQTAQSYLNSQLEFVDLFFELGKLCFDPALAGHRIETAQHMAAAMGHVIEEKFDHMQQATLQQNARKITHFLATAKAAGLAQGAALQQLGKLTKYVARLKKVMAAEKPMAESLGVAPLIENAVEKAGPKAAQQLGRAAEGGAFEAEAKVAETVETLLTKNDIQHFSKHISSEFAQQAERMPKDALSAILTKRTFFDPAWSKEDIIKYVEQAYKALRQQGLTGLHPYNVGGNTIMIDIQPNGKLSTAFGLHKLPMDYFIK
ncbi:MAG: hypothetical protein WC365_05535 [Candidatus Babeliales bacterium]